MKVAPIYAPKPKDYSTHKIELTIFKPASLTEHKELRSSPETLLSSIKQKSPAFLQGFRKWATRGET